MNMAGAVLVTGGSRRIGRSISLSLASCGFHIVIQTRSNDDEVGVLCDEIESLGVTCFIVEGNLDNPDSVTGIFDDTIKLLENNEMGLVGLVNSASMFEWDHPSNVNAESLIGHYRVNTMAPVLLSQMFHDWLTSTFSDSIQENLPCIVNILDQKLISPHPDHFSYTLSKQALSGATIMMAKAFAPICRVNSVSPGHVLPSNEQSSSGFEKAQSQSPLGYGPTPQDIADAVSFLFQARSITAQNLVVDSGEHLLGRNRDVVFETED
ncbi:MAG: short-chain dehydrogenase [Euryarchaeota archaeon]|nr:short-chain dehydrogenase [Euryarchaeota archaeon]